MSDRQQTYAKVLELIEPFNKKGVAVTEATRFAQDLEWDSLTVLDFVANIEDEFDVIISMNMQAEIETVGQLVDALEAEGELFAFPRTGLAAEECPASGIRRDDRPLLQVRPADRSSARRCSTAASPTRSTW